MAFGHNYNHEGQTIDGYYVEGISITYGNPRQHIWTYAVGRHSNRIAVFDRAGRFLGIIVIPRYCNETISVSRRFR